MSSARAASDQPDATVLARLITRDRLSSYLGATHGNLGRAVALYDWNTRASAAVLATTAMVEVIVRNALDARLQAWAANVAVASIGSMRRTWMPTVVLM